MRSSMAEKTSGTVQQRAEKLNASASSEVREAVEAHEPNQTDRSNQENDDDSHH